jgi:predicted aconitase with swiveling domain
MMLAGRFLVAGSASGPVFATAPLSFWGGVDPATGIVIDRSHPALGASLAGTMLVMVTGRGSSSSSTVFAEAIRLGTAPAAILLAEADPILVVGALVAARLYGRTCPLVLLTPDDHATAGAAAFAHVTPGEGDAARIAFAAAV